MYKAASLAHFFNNCETGESVIASEDRQFQLYGVFTICTIARTKVKANTGKYAGTVTAYSLHKLW